MNISVKLWLQNDQKAHSNFFLAFAKWAALVLVVVCAVETQRLCCY